MLGPPTVHLSRCSCGSSTQMSASVSSARRAHSFDPFGNSPMIRTVLQLELANSRKPCEEVQSPTGGLASGGGVRQAAAAPAQRPGAGRCGSPRHHTSLYAGGGGQSERVAAERTACLRSSSRRSRSDTMAAEGSRQTVKHAKAVSLATMNHGPPAFHPAWKPAFIPCKHDCSLPVMEPARLPSCLFYSC